VVPAEAGLRKGIPNRDWDAGCDSIRCLLYQTPERILQQNLPQADIVSRLRTTSSNAPASAPVLEEPDGIAFFKLAG
jgi:hypothetical protein